MKTSILSSTFLAIISLCFSIPIFGQEEIPLSYDVENTGADYPLPILPSITELPIVEPLTDPFEWSDGSGRDTTLASWSHRRAEIKAEIENYEIGIKPERPDTITASYKDGWLTVNVTENGQTLTLRSNITLPEGDGPFPAVIGMNSGTGSLSPNIFTSRNIATIPYYHDQVVTYGSKNSNDPYYKLYPNLYYTGQYASWAWGISRLIDGLELVKDSLPIDLSRLAVTGCSYAGKMALFAGAFDERIALTIAQESGGGGAAAWRVSQTLSGVENLASTSQLWFMKSMFQFGGNNVSKLPHDHHELMAMIAPRALLVFGNPDYVWLADESGYVSCRAAQKVWENFGVTERFGFVIEGGHMHCSASNNQNASAEAFVDRFLLGDTTVNTRYEINPYVETDYARWTHWWGKGEPAMPNRDWLGTESIWMDAECANLGDNWIVSKYSTASKGAAVEVKTGAERNDTAAPASPADIIEIPFTTTQDTTFYTFIRLFAPKDDGSSLWMKLDNDEFVKYTGFKNDKLEWIKVFSKKLTPGNHTLYVAFTAKGSKIDKFCISSYSLMPSAGGETSANDCEPVYYVDAPAIKTNEGYSLSQNYPNPTDGKTCISFEIPIETYVSLKVYNMLGAEIAELAGKIYSQGQHTVEFNSGNIGKGIYLYTLKTGNFTTSQKMVVQ